MCSSFVGKRVYVVKYRSEASGRESDGRAVSWRLGKVQNGPGVRHPGDFSCVFMGMESGVNIGKKLDIRGRAIVRNYGWSEVCAVI